MADYSGNYYIDGTGQKIPKGSPEPQPTGEFVTVANVKPIESCSCPKPSSNGGRDFGVFTIWVCLKCGFAWQLREISKARHPDAVAVDKWERCPAHDVLKIKETRQKYKDGDKTYD